MTVAFRIDVDAQLTSIKEERIELLCKRRAEFDATWRRDRGRESSFPFNSGRATDSEYEGSISFFLRAAGWDAQAIMNAIAAWNRLHGIQMAAYASRYGATIAKAFALAKLYSNEPAPAKTKGCWTQGETRERVLAAIQAGPRRPKEIVEELALKSASVRKTLGRLVEDGLVLHIGHQYLAARLPEAEVEVADEAEVTTPADAEVNMDELEAEYQKYVAELGAGSESAAEYDVEPPLESPAARIPATEASWLDCTDAELEAANVIREPDYSKVKHYSLAALKREKKWKGYASRFTVTANDLELRRLMAMDRPPLDEDTNPF